MCIDQRISKRQAQAGLSLVEIMVGVLIAMIGIVVIFQMLALSEERKRSASSGSDVQISGVIGLNSLERDVREAGYGFSSASYDSILVTPFTAVTPVMGCTVNAYDSGRPVPAFSFRLTPVLITQGAGGASDTLTVLRGNGNVFPAALIFTESTDTTKKTRGRSGLIPRDYLLIGRTAPSLQCMLVELTGVANADGLTIDHGQGSYSYPIYNTDGTTTTQTRIARYNNPTPLISFSSGFIFNLGNGARRNIWAVVDGKLQVTNDLLYQDSNGDGTNDPVEIADNVVTLQAEYGIDANNDGRIADNEWTTTDPATNAAWANVIAVRLGILARAGQFERTLVTTTVPSWSGGQFVITNLDGSASSSSPTDPADNWRNYRYRVYETVIPLRNILWGIRISP
jgi:type IV pilus assembly protein PilW